MGWGAMQVADTVVVVEGGAPEELTRFSGKSWNDVSYVIKEDDEADGSDVDELDDLHGSQPRRFAPVLYSQVP